MLTELSRGPRAVGAKQTRRAVETGSARMVFLATDADPQVLDPITALCDQKGVPVRKGGTMKEMGKACGITVGCAVAAVL